jgi:hypothetical protein
MKMPLNRTGELGHQPVAGVREYVTVRPMDFADEAVQCGVDPSMRRFFGSSHQQAVVADVSAENSRESTAYSSAPGVRSKWTFGRWRYHSLRRPRTNQ